MSASHTNTRAALARQDHLLPEHVDLEAEGRQTWRAVRGPERSDDMKALREQTPIYHIVARLCRQEDRSDPLPIIDRVIMWMARAGWPEERVRLLELHVRARIDQVYAGKAQIRPEAIDAEEQALDGAEDNLQMLRLLQQADGRMPSAEQLEEEADVRDRVAAVNITASRSLRRSARKRRATVEVRA